MNSSRERYCTFSHILSEDVGCFEDSGLVWLHSLLIILWWKSWPCCVCELSMRLVALTADDCMCVGVCKWTCACLLQDVCVCMSVSVSGGGLEASLAHHVVRLCWAAMSDCHFHQRQMITQPQSQKSRFLTLPVSLLLLDSSWVRCLLTVYCWCMHIYCDVNWNPAVGTERIMVTVRTIAG